MQQAELQIKAQEVQRKAEKDKADVALQQAEQARKSKKDEADAMLEAVKIEKGG